MQRYLLYSVLLVVMLAVACNKNDQSSVASKVVAPAKSSIASMMKTRVVNDTFKNTLFNLKEGLKDKGLVINNVAHISNMLKRTGKDLGKGKGIFGTAENIEFCSATLSRNMMSSDHRTIIFCPYIISVYTLPDNPKKTYVAYRRMPRLKNPKADKALQDVEKLLEELAKSAEGL